MFLVVELSFLLPVTARVVSRHRVEGRARASAQNVPGAFVVRVSSYNPFSVGERVEVSSIRAIEWLVNT